VESGSEIDWLGWMAWTPVTAAFFVAIALLLASYSVLGVRRPSLPRRGLLPLATTRGDRLFIGLLGAAYINLAWAALSDFSQWYAAVVWLPFLLVVGRWG
jgi:predicted small integral membrane protein